jgi:hypothetical protein
MAAAIELESLGYHDAEAAARRRALLHRRGGTASEEPRWPD